jgi:hypothetical protein
MVRFSILGRHARLVARGFVARMTAECDDAPCQHCVASWFETISFADLLTMRK